VSEETRFRNSVFARRFKRLNTVPVFVLFILLCTIIQANALPPKDNHRVSVVVIDPGHGGKDPGTIGGRIQEKDVVLDIALKLGAQIQNNFPEIEVIFTRKSDVFIPLHQRAEIANKADADLFISIHANAVAQKGVQGTETFVLGQHRSDDNLQVAKTENSVILLEDDYTTTYEGFDPNSPESYIMFELVQDEYKEQSISLANSIQNEFRLKASRHDRSVKEAGFLVLRRTTMPGVLIETGFLSNPTERTYLASESGKQHIAQAIFSAFVAYKKDIERKSSFHISTLGTQPATNENRVTANASPSETVQTKPETKDEVYYSVQLMALRKKIAPSPENFKGLDDVFRVDDTNISRYFSGKYASLQEAENHRSTLLPHFKSAFVVAFKNNRLISLKMLEESEN